MLHRIAIGRVRHIDAVAVDVELPAVIDAAQPALLVAAPEQVGAAMRAIRVKQPELAVGGAKGDEFSPKHVHSDRRAVTVRDLLRNHDWNPEPAEQLTHSGSRPTRTSSSLSSGLSMSHPSHFGRGVSADAAIWGLRMIRSQVRAVTRRTLRWFASQPGISAPVSARRGGTRKSAHNASAGKSRESRARVRRGAALLRSRGEI